MKNVFKISLSGALVLATIALAQGQVRKSTSGTSKKTISAQPTLCDGQTVLAGLVVVGYKSSATCGENSALIVKKPAPTEVVCASSPIPSGYYVIDQESAAACSLAGTNPLTNAIRISRDSQLSPQPISAQIAPAAPAYRRQTSRKSDSSADESSTSDNQRPSPSVSRQEIEIAVRRATVLVGMETQDVERAWGSPRTVDKLVEEDGLIHIWGYAMGRVYFRNGVVYKIELLRGR
jgi:hypothetical protein